MFSLFHPGTHNLSQCQEKTVQYGLIVQHPRLGMKCRFLEFEAYSNATLT